MRVAFTMIVVVAATLTSAAIIPRTHSLSTGDSGNLPDAPASRREVRARQRNAHPRDSLLFPRRRRHTAAALSRESLPPEASARLSPSRVVCGRGVGGRR
ncbi:hypothetical protein B0H16DRAFT_1556841 [Mycena metata]|uniref:Secreted protein n=1 Tax=Mycena metata TaxID=1033252 RepID=A0AAD7IPD5_9AGAR|nr:hypothetical protein B0H16DRAFT_1556841 [Mycena metata]